MQKIFKKSLALAVSAALCLTAFIGCLSVNAEGATPSYVVETKEGTPGEKVLINVKGTDLTAICGQSVDVVVAAGLDVTRVLEADKTTEMLPISTEDGGDYNKVVSDEGTTLKFVDIINFNDEITTANFEFNIEAVIPADAAVGTVYGVTLDGQFANLGEAWVTTNVTNGSVTVKSAEVPCEHNYEFVSAVPATESAEGSITLKCSECGETKTEIVSYYANFRISGTAADYASEISLVFQARNDRLAEKGEYTDAFVYFEHVLSSDNSTKVTVKNISEAEDTLIGTSQRPGKQWFYGVKAMQLTENVTANVFVNVGGVWYNGVTSNYSVRTYADSRLPAATDAEKTLIVDMLTYGSKMQQFKNYNVENLADANLGEYASYVTTTDPTIDAVVVDNHETTDVYINKYALDMASKIEAVMGFRSDRYTGTNKTDFVVRAEWKNARDVDLTQSYAKEASGDIKAYEPELQNGVPRENRYSFRFDRLASYDLRQEVTFYIYDGETEVSHGYTASIEALIAKGMSSFGEAEQAVYKAMLNYSDSSRAYFVG